MKLIISLLAIAPLSFAGELKQIPLTNNPLAPLAAMNNPEVNKTLLSSPFPVYVIGNSGVINHPYPGAKQVMLPTDNSYTGAPGCYIACYSHQPGVYAVSPTINVMGQIRVIGKYVDRICQPSGYENRDISAVGKFKVLCSVKIRSCHFIECWAGGDTGGWFGIQ